MSGSNGAKAASETSVSDMLSTFRVDAKKRELKAFSLGDYITLCKAEPMAYASAPERLLEAIGTPEIIDTANDKGPMKRIFGGKTIAKYPGFEGFYGIDDTLERIVSHIRSAAAGTENKKQMLFLLGPAGGGKSSLLERMKQLMEKHPIYALRDKKTGEISPIQESPLALLGTNETLRARISDMTGIPEERMKGVISPWAVKRLNEAEGDIDAAFDVVRIFPSFLNRIAVAKADPGDENNQDTSVLIGKLDVNKLGEGFAQNDTDCYAYSGALCKGNQGLVEMVEMFKFPPNVLKPLLEAPQSGHYSGNEGIGAVPFDGMIIGHSNISEYMKFINNPDNVALKERIVEVEVPYTMRVSQEAKIYHKMLNASKLKGLPIAPKTIDLLAKFSVMGRLSTAEGPGKYDPGLRAQVLDGLIPEGAKTQVPTINELRAVTPSGEGMSGISIRFVEKVLSATFNARVHEGEKGIDPVLLFEVLEREIKGEKTFSKADKDRYISLLKEQIVPEYGQYITEEITMAYTGANDAMCQGMFDRYINMADAWINGEDFNDKTVTGAMMSRDDLDKKLQEIEKPAGIVGGKDFRHEVVRYVHRKERIGEQVRWDSYEKLATVIRQNLQKKMKDVMPVIKFDATGDEKTAAKREEFIANMKGRGYTLPMIKRAVGEYEKTLG